MLKGFDIGKREWRDTPSSVRLAALALQHQLRLYQLRFTAYEKKITALEAKALEADSLKIEVAALREQLHQNSQNSSKPPSSDAPQHRRTYHHEPSEKQQGAQVGHPGHGRQLKPLVEVDHVIDFRPASCVECGGKLYGDDPHPVRHQVTEIPSVKAVVTEYRRHTLSCSRCGTRNEAAWDEEMPKSAFGPRVQATVAYLTGRLGLSHRDVVEAMNACHGVEMSLGTVTTIQRQVSAALAAPVQEAQGYVQQQVINYVDETRWKENGKSCWLWLNATRLVTVFRLLPRRNHAAAREMIGEGRVGIITTDRYGGYSWLSNKRRQLCWAHIKRDFQAIAERGDESKIIGDELLKQTNKMFDLWYQLNDGALDWHSFQQQMGLVRRGVRKVLDKGSRCLHPKTKRTCQQILTHEAALWRFVHIRGVEPTNNQAERALRRGVLWRRKSFGTQSEPGSRFVERILTVVTTLRQQKRQVLEYLTAVCSSHGMPARTSMCLLPTE